MRSNLWGVETLFAQRNFSHYTYYTFAVVGHSGKFCLLYCRQFVTLSTIQMSGFDTYCMVYFQLLLLTDLNNHQQLFPIIDNNCFPKIDNLKKLELRIKFANCKYLAHELIAPIFETPKIQSINIEMDNE